MSLTPSTVCVCVSVCVRVCVRVCVCACVCASLTLVRLERVCVCECVCVCVRVCVHLLRWSGWSERWVGPPCDDPHCQGSEGAATSSREPCSGCHGRTWSSRCLQRNTHGK